MTATKDRDAADTIRRIMDSEPLRRGQDWLTQTYLTVGADSGWGVEARKPPLTPWGGTVDGIRGLLAAGADFNDPRIVAAEEWLVRQQGSAGEEWSVRQQGSAGAFEAREIKWPSVEGTAWVVLVLRELKHPLDDNVIQKAITFLEGCIHPDTHGVGTSDSDKDPVRIYPSAISLMALHGLSRKEDLVAEFLKRSYKREEGGWGYTPTSPPNLIMTCYALYALLVSHHLRPDDEICKRALNLIYAETAKPSATWASATEIWKSVYQSPTDAPNPCHHYVVPWVIVTLLAAGEDPLDYRILRALNLLVSEQLPNGAWRYSPEDPNDYTWCVANALVAVREVQSALVTPVVNAALAYGVITADPPGPVGAGARLRRVLTQENVNTLLTVALFVIVFREPITSAAAWVAASILDFLGVQQTSIVSNVVGGIITTLVVTGLGSLFVFVQLKLRDGSGPTDQMNKDKKRARQVP